MTEVEGAALAKVQEIPDGGVLECQAVLASGPAELLLLRAGEMVRCFHNVCPHAGRSLNWAPGKFLIESGLLICAAHGASFSIPEGRCVLGPCRGQSLSEVAIEVHGGEVRVAAQGIA
ncbi:Rieske (2Fe-2S) protein [Pseudomarimonas arenosa]|uniref:Rieske (2Fe-2S) protein n=1 Tax=Pseudomarimonas arenosa TaxID=2774145 RepID=UPI002FC32819